MTVKLLATNIDSVRGGGLEIGGRSRLTALHYRRALATSRKFFGVSQFTYR